MKSAAVESPGRRVYRTVSAGMRTGWFIGPYIWNLAINFGANYGLEYGTLCQWGKDAMVDMQVWKLVHVPKSLSYTCIAMDVMVTAFLVAYFTCLLGPGMVVDAVKKGKLAPVAEEAVSVGVWRFFPMRTKNICKRSLLLGVEFSVTFGVLTTIIWTLALGNGSISGYSYCWFKAIWATFLAAMIYPISHFSAISTDKFTEEQLAESRGLLAGSKSGDNSQA